MILIHVDGHHKLVRWRFVTHGCIDGYSRMITFLKCSTNNRAETVYEKFLTAIQEFGLPSRVRCDYGKENYDVARHMLQYRGLHRNSVITGCSTHNQRIERLWRDLHASVTKMYYRLFYFLEHHSVLDPLNEVHLYALHFVYLPRINRAIDMFRIAWNNHGIRTVEHMSPRQLFVSGVLRLYESGLCAMDFFNDVDNFYGEGDSDSDTETESTDDREGVVVPQSRITLSPDQSEFLQLNVDPLGVSENYAIELYERAVELLQRWERDGTLART